MTIKRYEPYIDHRSKYAPEMFEDPKGCYLDRDEVIEALGRAWSSTHDEQGVEIAARELGIALEELNNAIEATHEGTECT